MQAILLSSLAGHRKDNLKKTGGCLESPLKYLYNTKENVINFLIADCSEKGIREGLVLEGDRELEPIAVTLRHKGGFSFAERVSVSQQFGSEYTIYLEKKNQQQKGPARWLSW